MNIIIKNNNPENETHMKSIKLFFLLLTFTVLTASLSAQRQVQAQRVPAEHRAKAQSGTLSRQLALSQEESVGVYRVVLKYELISDSLLVAITDPEERGRSFARYRELKDKDLKGVLTAGHYQQYIENRAKARARAQEESRPKTTK